MSTPSWNVLAVDDAASPTGDGPNGSVMRPCGERPPVAGQGRDRRWLGTVRSGAASMPSTGGGASAWPSPPAPLAAATEVVARRALGWAIPAAAPAGPTGPWLIAVNAITTTAAITPPTQDGAWGSQTGQPTRTRRRPRSLSGRGSESRGPGVRVVGR